MKAVGRAALAAALLLSSSSFPAHAELPATAQADLILQQIRVSLGASRIIETLDYISQYRLLKVPMPPPLLLLEARLAALTKDYPRSIAALEELLSAPNARRQPHYAEAVALYGEVTRQQENAVTARAERELAKAREACPVVAHKLATGMIFRDCALAPEMTVIPAGTFTMGSERPGYPAEHPAHLVRIESIAVGRFEMTFDDWEACVAGGGCGQYHPADRWGRGRQPVININWDDAQAYVRWLSAATGHRYRLLSEAEWEYAARGGLSTDFATGEELKPGDANFANPDGTVEVGRSKPNGFGLFDVHGNVWEWTEDCWNEDHSAAPTDGRARQSGECSRRVFRGGCWYNMLPVLHLSFRFGAPANSRNAITGLRVARELD